MDDKLFYQLSELAQRAITQLKEEPEKMLEVLDEMAVNYHIELDGQLILNEYGCKEPVLLKESWEKLGKHVIDENSGYQIIDSKSGNKKIYNYYGYNNTESISGINKDISIWSYNSAESNLYVVSLNEKWSQKAVDFDEAILTRITDMAHRYTSEYQDIKINAPLTVDELYKNEEAFYQHIEECCRYVVKARLGIENSYQQHKIVKFSRYSDPETVRVILDTVRSVSKDILTDIAKTNKVVELQKFREKSHSIHLENNRTYVYNRGINKDGGNTYGEQIRFGADGNLYDNTGRVEQRNEQKSGIAGRGTAADVGRGDTGIQEHAGDGFDVGFTEKSKVEGTRAVESIGNDQVGRTVSIHSRTDGGRPEQDVILHGTFIQGRQDMQQVAGAGRSLRSEPVRQGESGVPEAESSDGIKADREGNADTEVHGSDIEGSDEQRDSTDGRNQEDRATSDEPRVSGHTLSGVRGPAEHGNASGERDSVSRDNIRSSGDGRERTDDESDDHGGIRGADRVGQLEFNLNTEGTGFIPVFSVAKGKDIPVPEEYLKEVLIRGGGTSNSKMRIYEMVMELPDSELQERIRREYGIGGAGWPKETPGVHGYNYDGKGIKIEWRDDDMKNCEATVKWNQVVRAIKDLIRNNEYFTGDAANITKLYGTDLWKDYVKGKPVVYCRFSEDAQFTADTFYEPGEFVRTVDAANERHNAGKAAALDKYGSWEKWYEAKDDEYSQWLGYNKLHFILYMSGGVVLQDRFDIGSEKCTFIEFLRETGRKWYAEQLEEYITEVTVPEAIIEEEKDSVMDEEPAEEKVLSDVPEESAGNFVIENDSLGVKPLRQKFRDNVEAVRLLKELETGGLKADKEQQKILAEYVGWGGLSAAFDPDKKDWSQEYAEVKELLTKEEYAAARDSALSAFYTPPVVIDAMYAALKRMGFSQGNILEPACGVGNFMGRMPADITGRMYGIEIDELSARIAKQLYQDNVIEANGFEETSFSDGFFDLVIGNVPFGNFSVNDPKYNHNKFVIHDYFFAKALDKVRPGGIVAFITSKGTMDKTSGSIRKYISERAELVGAMRLPENTFTANAGTHTTTDIVFFKRRERNVCIYDEWTQVIDKDGIVINRYYAEHPEMVLGQLRMVKNQYGRMMSICADDGIPLKDKLAQAVNRLPQAIYEMPYVQPQEDVTEVSVIPANPDIPNFGFGIQNNILYYRENTVMKDNVLTKPEEVVMRAYIPVRESLRELIRLEKSNADEEMVYDARKSLKTEYNGFIDRYGRLTDPKVKKILARDSVYAMTVTLEKTDEAGKFIETSPIMERRTINPQITIDHANTPSEALIYSLTNKGCIDFEYMSQLTDIVPEELKERLKNEIFETKPGSNDYVTREEYLSGDVRAKLREAKRHAVLNEAFQFNVEALEKVQPEYLTEADIRVRIGATWIDEDYYRQFMYETFKTPAYYRQNGYYSTGAIDLKYVKAVNEWRIQNKTRDTNTMATQVYGTARMSGYEILEAALNLKKPKVYDRVETTDGVKSVINPKETMLAQQKLEELQNRFEEWLWQDPARKEDLLEVYNNTYNCLVSREYNGENLTFPGMNSEVKLRPHQKNAVARNLYGGNALYAHVVGAGKTYTIIASAMEKKRLGLANKVMIVVPKAILKQWQNDFLYLYPMADILVPDDKDFGRERRKMFTSRIAMGEYDAVIITQEQFQKIPMSKEYQKQFYETEISRLEGAIRSMEYQRGATSSVKMIQRHLKVVKTRMQKLENAADKDDLIDFESLGIDALYVDEAHAYKNLMLDSKMNNVSGLSRTASQKSSDMYMKTQYLNEKTGHKGVVFATGTPVSNSVAELYTMQRYLQPDLLQRYGLEHFDQWAAAFGDTVTQTEISPTGGYRSKTRFAKFFNVPELMVMFKQVADIQVADMLNLPGVPDVEYEVVAAESSPQQKEYMEYLVERCDDISSNRVDSSVDNMLKITTESKLLSLDQRLVNNPDKGIVYDGYEESKVVMCCRNVYDIWEKHKDVKAAQAIFCDLSTPKKDKFNVYDDIKHKLVDMGIPESEIAYIHSCQNDAAKKEMLNKVNTGSIRVILGSTEKLGTGVNMQERLVATHDLDCPWRPSDLEQRAGRIVRQGNQYFDKVKIYRYVTKNTFDAYLFQTIEAKMKFINQIMTSRSSAREMEDCDEATLAAKEAKAIATGNPLVKEHVDLVTEIAKLTQLKGSYNRTKYELERKINIILPKQIEATKDRIECISKDIKVLEQYPSGEVIVDGQERDRFYPMTIDGVTYTDKKEAGQALTDCMKLLKDKESRTVGEWQGFKLILEKSYLFADCEYRCTLRGAAAYLIDLEANPTGTMMRLSNAVKRIPDELAYNQERLTELGDELTLAGSEAQKTFAYEQLLKDKQQRLHEVEKELGIGEDEIVMTPEENVPEKAISLEK